MHIAEVGFLKKQKNFITSFIRNASCSSGWLRFVVQIIFGALIVTSFILIVLMALGSSQRGPKTNSRCTITNCRVICNEAPYYGDHEEDIVNVASEVDPNCNSIALQLNRPTFENSKIPENWLSRIRSNVRELAIIGGNTEHIPSYAFMSPMSSNIRTLILEKIEINRWDNDMLIGLSNLKNLFIKNCFLPDIRKNALRIIDESLELLDIKAINHFDPVNLTGFADLDQLRIVDLSSNTFYNVLGNTSFSKLKRCKVLFLNSCKITAIGPGTFDYLYSIEVLYLNDNYLVTIPVGLFNTILPLHPRIALQENYWHCDCFVDDLRIVFNQGLLIIDPICRYPDAVNGLTFSDFEGYCNNGLKEESVNLNSSEIIKKYPCHNVSKVVYLNGVCSDRNSSSSSSSLDFVPVESQKCLLNRISHEDFKLASFNIDDKVVSPLWIKPSFLVQSNPYSMIEMTSSAQPGLGLLWYKSSCLNEVYCTNTIPNVLKVFNLDTDLNYIFCQFNLSTGTIVNNNCVSYNLGSMERNFGNTSTNRALILNICISLGCLICGAISVYVLIQRNPSLLKGNKRVVFVKHKSIEALILPPRLPMRNKLNDKPLQKSVHNIIEKKNIFLLPDKLDTVSSENFIRSISTRSSGSYDASYISALQPTEEQLKEWRSNRTIKQFDTPSSDIDMSPLPSIYDRDSLPYYSFHSSERLYEVPKQY